MTLQAWLLFCATETVLCLSPGPAVLLVVSLSLTRGARAGFPASLGILAANALYFAVSATGIGAILLASWDLFFLIKWLGAAYLVWLGARMLLAPPSALPRESEPELRARRATRPFAHGLITQGANPKVLIYFTAILPQFITVEGSVPVQVAILGVSSMLIELAVLALYIALCHRARRTVHHPGVATALARAGGVLLISAGARLATMRRS